jgi:T5SS/PEP-CTERM-associated repeat protein
MNVRRQPGAAIGILAGVIILAWLVPIAHAQFTADYQTNIISGVTSNWAQGTDYYIGGNRNPDFHLGFTHDDVLRIDSGGVFFDHSGFVGGRTDFSPSSNNTAVVTGLGSVWSNQLYCWVGATSSGNSLVISNGGQVVDYTGYVGETGGNNNSVVVTGTGSLWISSYEMTVGQDGGASNTLLISNGGQVFDTVSQIGDLSGVPTNNSVTVTDPGSVWNVSNNLRIGGTGPGNSLAINNGGLVLALTVEVNSTNSITLGRGILSVTNQLTVAPSATVSGCGTINGSLLIYAGGTVEADCGGPLTFTSNVTNNGTMRAIDGSVLESYGTVVNNGIIDIINGTTNFHGTFINNGTVLDPSNVRISNVAVSGNDVSIQIGSITCHTYQVQITPSLTPTTWTNSYPAQAGTGGVLTFTDSGGATNQPTRFYRIVVGD